MCENNQLQDQQAQSVWFEIYIRITTTTTTIIVTKYHLTSDAGNVLWINLALACRKVIKLFFLSQINTKLSLTVVYRIDIVLYFMLVVNFDIFTKSPLCSFLLLFTQLLNSVEFTKYMLTLLQFTVCLFIIQMLISFRSLNYRNCLEVVNTLLFFDSLKQWCWLPYIPYRIPYRIPYYSTPYLIRGDLVECLIG